MSNLTISVDDELIKRARIRAIQQGTSLSAKVREFLLRYVDETDGALQRERNAAAATLMSAIELAAALGTPAAPNAAAGQHKATQRRTLRDELYEGDFRKNDRQAADTAPLAGDKR